MPWRMVDEEAPRPRAARLFRGLLLAAFALPAAAAPPPDAGRARKLAATGIPHLCAERFDADPARERCVEHQLEAGRRVRAILLANRDDAELAGTVERCAAGATSSSGAYDWVKIKDCTDLWLRNAVRERSR
jgi:hypothetical protein